MDCFYSFGELFLNTSARKYRRHEKKKTKLHPVILMGARTKGLLNHV